MTGSITISLKDFDGLRKSSDDAAKIKERVLRATKELEVFLSFLCTRETITDYVDEFNSQSKTSKIILEDGRAKIKLDA
jgi:hypothetical protein